VFIGRQLQVRQACQHFFEKDSQLQTRQTGAEAEVRPVAKGEVLVGLALHVECERITKGALVAVGRRVEQQQLVTGADALPV
jgi:hypothetical protein